MNHTDPLDEKLNAEFEGRVVRKDLLHRIKKGTNVPTFVLEFLLARYCASDDPDEIDAGMEAVVAAAPGHVTAVRELVFDALSRSQVKQLQAALEGILTRVDPGGRSDPFATDS